MRTWPRSLLLVACFSLPTAGGAAAGDPAKGGAIFRQCAACHSTVEGRHLTGPSLAGIWKRKAGTVEGFRRYSSPLQASGAVWDEAALDRWLADPQQFVPGTTMTFPGIRNADARRDLIAYLRAVSEDKAAAGPPGGMPRKPDLRKAPPEGQVRAITHCGDTYTVETRDGRREKVWEFNLRFKTDTSDLGPYPGKPVVVGAGMRGDRASVIFAAPAEISRFIRSSCE